MNGVCPDCGTATGKISGVGGVDYSLRFVCAKRKNGDSPKKIGSGIKKTKTFTKNYFKSFYV